MLKRKFPKTGWEVGVIGLGTWGIGGQWGAVDKDTAIAAVHASIDAGVNFLDTADAYGNPPGTSERFVSEAIRGHRDRLFVATKVGNFGRSWGHPLPFSSWLHVELCCDASLQRLKTDYIDLYQCHIPDCRDPSVYLEAFDRLLTAGKIRAFGISTNRLDVAGSFNENSRCAAVQFDYSFLNRSPEETLLPYCAENQIAAILRGPLAQGVASGKFTRETRFDDAVRAGWNEGDKRQLLLERLDIVDRVKKVAGVDRSLAQTALRFAISHPAATVAIPGAKNAEQARQNAAAGEAVLNDVEYEALKRASAPGATGLTVAGPEQPRP